MSRLKLDFSLNTAPERAAFLQQYINSTTFQKVPPTEEELEMMGNYMLWGKDPITGLNATQTKDVQIETRNKTWDPAQPESLEALMESPGFNDAMIRKLNAPRLKVVREVFDRKKTLSECPNEMREAFETLFKEIDSLDLMINYYDLAHNKRKNPPSDKLLNQFTEDEKLVLEQKASHLNQYQYLKKRHALVELRRQQFLLRDSFASPIMRHNDPVAQMEVEPPEFEVEVPVLPLGLAQEFGQLIFQDFGILCPDLFDESQLQQISDFYWSKQQPIRGGLRYFDFREPDHIYQLFDQWFDLQDKAARSEVDCNTDALMRTLDFYIRNTELTEVQKEVLDLKIKKVKNQDIALYVNKKYDKSYTINYISTIFRQKILPKICATAVLHEKIVSNLFFVEEFKKCKCCGRTLLRDADNFVRKTRAKDGYSNQCKKCDKSERQKKKGVVQ